MIHLHGTRAVAFRVLIVDDDPMERAILARCMKMLGWTATTASGVDDATEKLASGAHDVVAADPRLAQPDWVRSLPRMPFIELKIDRSIVAVRRTDPDAWKLVRATISLARELDMPVVAEGIESEAISDRLRDAGCDMGQGWYFGRPTQDHVMPRWLKPDAASGALAKAVVMAGLLTADASHALPATWMRQP